MFVLMNNPNATVNKVETAMSENAPEVDQENPVEDFHENMAEEDKHALKSAMPGIHRALAFMRRKHVELMEDLPLDADAQVRVARGQIFAIDELKRDLDQFNHTGEREVGDQITQRVGRPGRR